MYEGKIVPNDIACSPESDGPEWDQRVLAYTYENPKCYRPQAAAALGEQWRSMQSLGRSSLGASYERPRNLHHLEGRNQDSQQTAVVGIWRRLSATIRSHSAASLIRTAFAFEEEAIALAILRYSSARSISSSIVSAGGCSIAM
jgi:hypothetical protein